MEKQKMTETIDTKEYFECGCHSAEHLLVFEHSYWEMGNGFYENELLVTTFLNHRHSVFSRAWLAIKYVFGFKVRDSHFDYTIIVEKDVSRLLALCQKVIDKGKNDWKWDEAEKKYCRMEDGVKIYKVLEDDDDYYKVGV